MRVPKKLTENDTLKELAEQINIINKKLYKLECVLWLYFRETMDLAKMSSDKVGEE